MFDILGKPFEKGTINKKAKSIWTPGMASRSSFRSSMSSRSRRSFSSS
jgi:hypothetical protein